MSRWDRRLRLCVCLVVLALSFIWGNSLLPGTASQAFSEWVREVLAAILPGDGLQTPGSGGLLRKLAHFTEFTVLGLLLGWLSVMLKKKGWTPVLWGAAAACLDETIQMFVPGRGPGLRDVLIDCCGILTGVILLRIGYHYYRKKQ